MATDLTFSVGTQRYVCDKDLGLEGVGPLIGMVRLDERGHRVYSGLQILAFLSLVLDQESQQRLLVAIHDKRRVVPLQTLGVAAMWVAEQQTFRPFSHARALASWAASHWSLLRGRLLRNGVNPDNLSLRDVIDIAYVELLDDVPSGVGGETARQRLDDALDKSWADRETWGMTPAAERAQRAMMEQVPPAPMRDPNQRRPDAAQNIRDRAAAE